MLFGPAPAFQREHVRAAAVEPDVENVGDHLVIVGISVAEEVGGIRRVTGVDALFAEGGEDAVVHLMVDEQFAACARRTGRWYAPGALTAEHPVGTPSTIDPRRLRPFSGTKRVAAMAFIASSRSVAPWVSSTGSAPPSLSQRCSARVSR